MIHQSRRALLGAAASLLAVPALAQTANTPVITGQSTAQPLSVIDALAAAGNFDEFIEWARRAGAVEILRGPGPFTLLAPTNAAMGRLPASLREQLNPTQVNATGANPDIDPVRLRAFVDMHIIPGRYTLADLANRTTTLRTRNDNAIEVVSTAGQAYQTRLVGDMGFGVGGVNAELRPTRFLVPEIQASNGVVLPIDVPLIQ